MFGPRCWQDQCSGNPVVVGRHMPALDVQVRVVLKDRAPGGRAGLEVSGRKGAVTPNQQTPALGRWMCPVDSLRFTRQTLALIRDW